MWEELYARQYEEKTGDREKFQVAHVEYKGALEELYRSILKYQITCYCYYIKDKLSRVGRDMVQLDDWPALIKDVRERKVAFDEVTQIWRDVQYNEECEASERRHRENARLYGPALQALRNAIETEAARKERQELLDWLCQVNPSGPHGLARKHHRKGTGEWLLGDGKFQTWMESPGSLLWLHGKGRLAPLPN